MVYLWYHYTAILYTNTPSGFHEYRDQDNEDRDILYNTIIIYTKVKTFHILPKNVTFYFFTFFMVIFRYYNV